MEKEVKQQEIGTIQTSKKTKFLKRTVLLFILFFLALALTDTVPSSVREINNALFSFFVHDEDVEKAKDIVGSMRVGNYTEPVRVVIPSVGTDVSVINPIKSDIETLNAALLLGAVRYPGSGDLEDKHTMFLFGHSSYLPVVHNKAYQSFNNVQKLNFGDVISVFSNDKEYVYTVEKVEQVNADESFIDLSSTDRKLVLVTCNVFGTKQDRFVVTARFVESKTRAN